MTKRQFKIDFECGRSFPYALFIAREGWLRVTWEKVYDFETRAKAKEYYEMIKDLPEYL